MKRLWVAIFLLVICFSTGIYEYSAVSKNQMKIAQIIDNAENYISNKEYKEAYNMSRYALIQWENECRILNVFLIHSDTSAVTENLNALCEHAQNKNVDEFAHISDKTKRQLHSLKESELPLFENVL